ncbi:ABC transporter permease subunit [Nocardioides zeae]|uniref:ATP-binding cassette domain-containing protein n=1 Tax=Nocardioides zeae TaxID=1457234 RepID=A0A6P0HNB8_9ACTN|nr:ATP-binding cassette domain-containing protein [Nocardioides zeae]NEN79734.1 ATP-binding cassette domain-containing protein [Nocardioides zeae]
MTDIDVVPTPAPPGAAGTSGRRKRRRWVADLARPSAAGAFAVALGLVFANDGFWLTVITSSAILYVLVAAYNVIFGYAGLFNLAHVAIYGVGGYASVVIETELGVSFWVSVPMAMGVALVASLVVALPTSRLGGAFFALGTLAFAIAATEVTTGWDEVTGGANGYLGIAPPIIGDTVLFAGELSFYWLVAAVAVVCFEIFYRFGESRVARELVAVRESVVAAQTVGIDPWRRRMLAFTISGTFAGLAGALVAHQMLFISPESFSLHIMINVLIVVLIGGGGTRLGPVIGVVALVAIQEAGEQLGDMSNLIFGAAIILIFAFAPRGLVGVGRSIAQRLPSDSWPRRIGARPVPFEVAALPESEVGAASRRLEVAGVDLSFAGVTALQGVGLAVESGEVLGLIGPNGAGKTSMVNVVSGMVRPQAGSVRLDGDELVGLAPHAVARRGVVRTFQSARMIPEFDLITNVVLGRGQAARSTLVEQMLDLPRSRRDEEEAYYHGLGLLELVGVREHAHQTAGDLPYGVVRRAEIARALAGDPAFLLLDEPGAGLSNYEREEIAEAIRAAVSRGVGCLLIDHNVEFVSALCARLVVFAQGRVIAEGASAEVLAQSSVIEAYLGGASR